MRTPESLYVPIPVARVAEHLTEIQDAYIKVRRTTNASLALEAALDDVLDASDREQAAAFLAGQLDRTYGAAGDGANFRRGLAESLEALYTNIVAYDERAARRARMDVVDLAEDLATDQILAGGFAQAVSRGDAGEVSRLVGLAARYVLQKSSGPRSRTGRKVKVQQAARVFDLLGRKAARAPGNIEAGRQATWCAAVSAALRPYWK